MTGSRSGYYVFTSGWDAGGTEQVAGLVSPNFTLHEPSTLSFWYQMNGNGIGSLSLLLYQLGRVRSRPSLLWRVTGRQGLDWRQNEAHLYPGHWQVKITTAKQREVVSGRTCYGDV